MPQRLRLIYPVSVGLLLGLLQTGLFFQLTFALSSGYTTYLLITLCWLAGGALGAYYVSRLPVSLRRLLVGTLLAYAVCGALVMALPFNTRIWLIYAVLIGAAGVYPGVFFARTSRFYTARTLFFLENNGFVVGLVLCTLLFMLTGRGVLWVLPLVVAVGIWLMSGEWASQTEMGTPIPNDFNEAAP